MGDDVPAVLLTSLYAVALTLAVAVPGTNPLAACLVAAALAHRVARHVLAHRLARGAVPVPVETAVALPRP